MKAREKIRTTIKMAIKYSSNVYDAKELGQVLTPEKKRELEKQGYRIVGNHSAVKICEYTRKSIRGKDVCYKCTFYGIQSWRCVQMTPSLQTCSHRCRWCWRDIEYASAEWVGPVDAPKDIVEGCIKEHVRLLLGFGGTSDKIEKRYAEMKKPLHFAISLSGEPTAYPRLPELIDEVHSRAMTTFLVTNAEHPDMLEKLLAHQPTQLYVTLPAPDERTFLKSVRPLAKNGWQTIMKSLEIFNKFTCRKVVRLTLVKNVNMINPEGYAEILKKLNADFFELKGYVWVGYSRERLKKENMPTHDEIKEFSKRIAELTGLKIVQEKKESRVVLLVRDEKIKRHFSFSPYFQKEELGNLPKLN